mgnify:CR=1 FL=1
MILGIDGHGQQQKKGVASKNEDVKLLESKIIVRTKYYP